MKTKIQEYLKSDDVMGLAESTRDQYKNALKHLGRYISGNSGMHKKDKVDAKFMGNFARYLKDRRKLSGQSIQQYLTCVKVFLRWAGTPVEYTYKITNEERKENKRKHLKRWFTELDIDKCLAYDFPNGNALRNKIIVRLLIETGCRVRELSFVTGKDIDIDDGIIWLRDSKTEPRPAFFSPKTAGMLTQLQETSLFEEKELFPDVKAIKHIITNMLEKLGLKGEKDGRGSHTMRHWFASYLFYHGDARIEDIAFLMGDTVDTIRNRYLHPESFPMILKEKVGKAFGWEF